MAAHDYAITTDDQQPTTVPPSAVRSFVLLCILGGLIAAAGASWSTTVDPVVTVERMSYPFSANTFRVTEVVWTLTHLLTFFGALGLARSGVGGRGRTAKIGRPFMLAGMALLVPCELAFVLTATSAVDSGPAVAINTAIGISATLAGVGFTVVGIAVLRERRWTGVVRWTPLLVGVYELLVITAVAPLSGSAFLFGIAGWNVCFALLGLALWARTPERRTAV